MHPCPRFSWLEKRRPWTCLTWPTVAFASCCFFDRDGFAGGVAVQCAHRAVDTLAADGLAHLRHALGVCVVSRQLEQLVHLIQGN